MALDGETTLHDARTTLCHAGVSAARLPACRGFVRSGMAWSSAGALPDSVPGTASRKSLRCKTDPTRNGRRC